jgi:hypothetical protein
MGRVEEIKTYPAYRFPTLPTLADHIPGATSDSSACEIDAFIIPFPACPTEPLAQGRRAFAQSVGQPISDFDFVIDATKRLRNELSAER